VTRWPLLECLALALATAGCGARGGDAAAPSPPSHVEHPEPEADLAVLHLDSHAVSRLAIETAPVEEIEAHASRLVGGEVIAPPGRVVMVTAPIAGAVRLPEDGAIHPGAHVSRGQTLLRLVPLAPVDRDIRARAEREASAARAQLEAAEARVGRVEALMAERAASQRLLDEAVAARDVARADATQADARARVTRTSPLLSDVSMTVQAPEDGVVRALSALDRQSVAAGAAIMEIVPADALEVRVPVASTDLARLDPAAPALVEASREGPFYPAAPALAPLTSDVVTGTVDRYFALASAPALVLGQRVVVRLPLRGAERARAVPAGAIVYDAHGGAWVYVAESETAFRRTRVDPLRIERDRALLAAGPSVGTRVVSVGAAELFGAEFPPGH
jgi:cobalt-zinc-cadmium efflux system membrane fusion protein